MTEKTHINLVSLTDAAIIKRIGEFVKDQRISKNLTQAQVAQASGINRYTVGKLENGESVNLSSFIQVLRVLDLLYTLEGFNTTIQISPLEAVKLQARKRKRVRNSKEPTKPKSDW